MTKQKDSAEKAIRDIRRATSAILQTEDRITMNLMRQKPLLNQTARSPRSFDDVQ